MPDAATLVARLVEDGVVPGAALAVADHAGIVQEFYAGFADRERAQPVAATTRFALASLTKPLIACAALVAVEEGSIDLDQPLRAVLPGVADQVTLRGALAHMSGLPESASPTAMGLQPRAEWSALRDAYRRVAPVAAAGTRRIYSNPAYALAGAAVEEASGLGIDLYLAEAVLEPLGLADTSLALPETSDAAWVRDAGLWAPRVPLFNDPWFRRQPLPQSGGWSTARDYAAFLRCILREGAAGAAAILAPETCRLVFENQGGALPGGVESFMTWPRADWAIGFEVLDAKERHYTGTALSAGALTHFGASGTLCFVDADRGIAAVLLANRGTYSGWMLAADAWPGIVAALIGA